MTVDWRSHAVETASSGKETGDIVTGSFPTSTKPRRTVSARTAERRGRGIRGPILPPQIPRWRTRREEFDSVVLEAFAYIDERFHDRLTGIDLAVDLIPRLRLREGIDVWPEDVVADGRVPLSRLVPAGVDRSGNPVRPRIVLFRAPLEKRADSAEDLEELVRDVLVEQIAFYLNLRPEDIDPTPRRHRPL